MGGGPLRWVLAGLGAGAVVSGTAGAATIGAATVIPHRGLVAGVGLLIGWLYVAVGLYAWWRRPDNRVGPLMTAVGYAWFASGLWLLPVAWLHTVGLAVSVVYYAVLIHLLLAFPSGRLGEPAHRTAVVLAYVVALGCELAALPFLDTSALGPTGTPNLLLVRRDDQLAAGVLAAAEALGGALLIWVTLLLVRRWHAATAVSRRALAPVFWAGAAAGVLSAVHLASTAGGVTPGVDMLLLVSSLAAMTAVPCAFLVGLARTRFFHTGAVGELIARLGTDSKNLPLRDTLAAALDDARVEVAYWLADRGRYSDGSGRPVELPVTGDGRAVVPIARDGRPVGAVVVDAGLVEDPSLLDGLCGALALAMDNERLHAELRARVLDLERSRQQVVEAGEAQRRRLERDLHDGAQQRLVAVRLRLGLLRGALAEHSAARSYADRAVAELDDALAELRALARGLHPALLSTRGLDAALRSLAARSPVPVRLDLDDAAAPRPPGAVESAAYYIVAEALTNVVKHAAATAATVRLTRQVGWLLVEVGDDGVGGADPQGAGLRGLAARVSALDGRWQITSPPSGGTVIRAEIPEDH